jgi:sigma-B regulation protein RsbU (phosphoserine phosphatase)
MRQAGRAGRHLVVALVCVALVWALTSARLAPLPRAAAVLAGAVLLAGAAEALRQWLYDPPAAPPAGPSVADRALASELEIGFELQRRFLPGEAEVSLHGLHLAGRCLPARGVSGDTYDFGALDDQRAMLLLADVAGKGIPAALLMAVFHSSFRSRLIEDAGELVLMLQALNDQIHVLGGPNRYVTAFCAVYQRQDCTLTYASAGHFPALLCTGGRLEHLEAGGMPLGVFAGTRYVQGSTVLEPGSTLVIYSDGAIEAVNKAGVEFGAERLESLVRAHQGLAPGALRDLLFRALHEWNDDFVQEDDITILVVQRLEA